MRLVPFKLEYPKEKAGYRNGREGTNKYASNQGFTLSPAAGLGTKVDVAVDEDVDCDLIKLGAAVVEIEAAAVVVAVIE